MIATTATDYGIEEREDGFYIKWPFGHEDELNFGPLSEASAKAKLNDLLDAYVC